MKAGWRWAAALVMTSAVWAGCKQSSGRDESERNNPGLDTPRQEDSGTQPPPPADAGTGVEDGGGTPPPVDAGTQQPPDAGTQQPPDAGTQQPPDAGTQKPPPAEEAINFPSPNGWRFFGTQHGGPRRIYGVTSDKSGNVWVAGGEEGLFLLAPGADAFRRFTMADGLRPYGYMPDGSAPPGEKYLKVISVAGGPADTVFVGYEGRPGTGPDHCESNWDGIRRDPSRYKSGDADRVTLKADGTLAVVHYDIFSGPDVVRDEPEGREKLCNVLRMAYDESTNSIWFGANHGFARADADFPGNPLCNGKLRCSGVEEHTHPALNAYGESGGGVLLTDAYYGVAVHSSGDVFFGGANRSTRFRYRTAGNFWSAQTQTEGRAYADNRIDVWKDAVQEPSMPRPNERVDDNVSGMSVLGNSVWVTSFTRGLARMNLDGGDIQYVSVGERMLSAVAADPSNDSLWVGARWLGVVYQVKEGQVRTFGCATFGTRLCSSRVSDIQVDNHGGRHRILVGFMGSDENRIPGAIGIYTGN
ncbi:MAG TPA: proline-rich domain-containing protein [Archangium sp.]|nr:proline-rich domain-containing protein [Archangium sp.]